MHGQRLTESVRAPEISDPLKDRAKRVSSATFPARDLSDHHRLQVFPAESVLVAAKIAAHRGASVLVDHVQEFIHFEQGDARFDAFALGAVAHDEEPGLGLALKITRILHFP